MNTLIAYGTRYGATASTAEEIAKILTEAGFTVKVANLKEEKIKDISPYDLVVVGTGVQIGKWTGEAEGFLKKHDKELTQKKMALFVSTLKALNEREGKPEDLESTRQYDIDKKLPKYSFQPISIGFFGGVLDYNKMNFFFRKTMVAFKERIEQAGFKEEAPGVYDMRDWDEIRGWAKELAEKAKV